MSYVDPPITIDGKELSFGQRITLYVALLNFEEQLAQEPPSSADPTVHERLCDSHRSRLVEIFDLYRRGQAQGSAATSSSDEPSSSGPAEG